MTDETGTLLARYLFGPWGRRTLTFGADVTSIGFTGHEAHGVSGSHLALYRAYDPDLGRWVSEDPSGFTDGTNLYSYVSSSPTSQLDPLGLMKVRNLIKVTPVDQEDLPPTAVAMTNVSAAFTCGCKCDGGEWKLEGILLIGGEMLLPRVVTQKPAVDHSVRDFESAKHHEYAWHIDPATDGVRKIVEPYESKSYASEKECQGACNQLRPRALKKFYNILRMTKSQEESRR